MPRRRIKGLRPAIDLAGLADLETDDLRRLWAESFGIEPLPRISRELLVRAVAYRLQEEKEGGMSRRAIRQLDRALADMGQPGRAGTDAHVSLRTGTRLVREWQGRVHEVIVLEEDYLWQGERFRSLSEIARLITGARWSGPRFFGTRPIDAKRRRSGEGERTRG
jgi:hypothetical protein